jgi:hypothetical protein
MFYLFYFFTHTHIITLTHTVYSHIAPHAQEDSNNMYGGGAHGSERLTCRARMGGVGGRGVDVRVDNNDGKNERVHKVDTSWVRPGSMYSGGSARVGEVSIHCGAGEEQVARQERRRRQQGR